MFIPDLGSLNPNFFPIRDPEVKKAPDPDPGAGSATLVFMVFYIQ